MDDGRLKDAMMCILEPVIDRLACFSDILAKNSVLVLIVFHPLLLFTDWLPRVAVCFLSTISEFRVLLPISSDMLIPVAGIVVFPIIVM